MRFRPFEHGITVIPDGARSDVEVRRSFPALSPLEQDVLPDAEKFGAADYVDPRPFAVGSIIDTFEKYYADREEAVILPAMGYGEDQMKDLQQTINASDCDAVIIATPIDLTRIIKINKPVVRVGYDLQEIGKPDLPEVLKSFVD